MPRPFCDIVAAAVKAWTALCDVSPNAEHWKTYEEYEIQQTYQRVNAGLEEDFSGLTALLTLRKLFQDALQHSTIDYRGILADEHLPLLEKFVAARNILYCDEANQPVLDFLEQLREFKTHYNLPDSVDELITDEAVIGELREEVYKANKTLEELRFLKGLAGGEIQTYNRVLEVWNTASLVRLASNTDRDFIALVMVRDEAYPLESFFCICCRYGQNVTLWTDRADLAHPLQKSMRRNARAAASRMEQWFFPYDLLEVEFSDKQRAGTVKSRTGIVPLQQEFLQHCDIKDLQPCTALWVLLLMELLVERVKAGQYRVKALSYVGESIVFPGILGCNNALIKESTYPALKLPRMDAASLEAASATLSEDKKDIPKVNQWMLDRYAADLQHDDLVIVELTKIEGGSKTGGHRRRNAEPKDFALSKISPLVMGTTSQLTADVRFIARYNQVQIANERAQEEHARRLVEIANWVTDRIENNRERLLAACAIGEVYEDDNWQLGHHKLEIGLYAARELHCFIGMRTEKSKLLDYHDYDSLPRDTDNKAQSRHVLSVSGVYRPGDDYKRHNLCCIRGVTASILFQFAPQSAAGLAWLCGVEVEELPDVLQHWTLTEPYEGNHILDKIDPVFWATKNPWMTYKPRAYVPLSKTAYKQLRQQYRREPKTLDEQKG